MDAARTRALLGLSEALARSPSRAQVAEAIVRHGKPLLEADGIAVVSLDGDEVEALARDGVTAPLFGETRRAQRSAALPLCEAIERREPLWRDGLVAFPLAVGGGPFAAVGWHFAAVRPLGETERLVAAIAVNMAAVALDRARAGDVNDPAVATRLRDVAHDLKNPIGAILMAATALLQLDLTGSTPEESQSRVHKRADIVLRGAQELVRLIDQLSER